MKISFTLLLFLIAFLGNSQDTITQYYDADWEETDKESASYLRKAVKVERKNWLVSDYFITGQLQMIGHFRNKKFAKKNGEFTYFNINGNKKNQGFYKKDLKVGEWIWYHKNGEISSIEQYSLNKMDTFKFFDEEGNELLGDLIYEIEPEFPGGIDSLYNFLGNNTVYPPSALENGVQGKVYISFIIDKDGSIEDVKVIKSIHSVLDKEATRVIKSMPNWTPGKQHNICVKTKYNIPINFNLN
ncbi:MAG: protein TonB [Parvicella sp.]|jgi:protein TonB